MKYSDEELEGIFEEVIKWRGQGLSQNKCAAMAKIDSSTLGRWLKKGEKKRSKFHNFKKDYDYAHAKWYTHHLVEYNRKCESPADHYRILIKDKDFNPELRINANVKKEGLADRQDLIKQFDKIINYRSVQIQNEKTIQELKEKLQQKEEELKKKIRGLMILCLYNMSMLLLLNFKSLVKKQLIF